jgi:hypothetical protein
MENPCTAWRGSKRSITLFAVLFLILIFHSSAENPTIARSCDGAFTLIAFSDFQAEIRFQAEGRKELLSVDHYATAGAISNDGATFVVYGLPRKIDRRNPQATAITFFKRTANGMLIHRVISGGGIYQIGFDVKKDKVFLEYQHGVLMFDFKTKTLSLSDEPMPDDASCNTTSRTNLQFNKLN